MLDQLVEIISYNVLTLILYFAFLILAICIIFFLARKLFLIRKSKILKTSLEKAIPDICSGDLRNGIEKSEEIIVALEHGGYDLDSIALNELKIRYALNLGYIRWRENKIKDAIKWTKKALQYEPKGDLLGNVKSNLAYFYAEEMNKEKRKEALELAESARNMVENHPEGISWHINYAFVKYKYAALQKDKDSLSEAIKLLEELKAIEELREEATKYLTDAKKRYDEIT